MSTESLSLYDLITSCVIFVNTLGSIIICTVIAEYWREFWFNRKSKTVMAKCATKRIVEGLSEGTYKYQTEFTFIVSGEINGVQYKVNVLQNVTGSQQDKHSLLNRLAIYDSGVIQIKYIPQKEKYLSIWKCCKCKRRNNGYIDYMITPFHGIQCRDTAKWLLCALVLYCLGNIPFSIAFPNDVMVLFCVGIGGGMYFWFALILATRCDNCRIAVATEQDINDHNSIHVIDSNTQTGIETDIHTNYTLM
eukprot:146326_1